MEVADEVEFQIVCELKKQIQEHKLTNAGLQCAIQDLEEKLAAAKRSGDKGCKTIQILLLKTEELDAEIQNLRAGREGGDAAPSTAGGGEETRALRAQLLSAQAEVSQVNQWRKECLELCNMLTGRLSELAGFLDSLLNHKDVLSVLAQDRRKAMRKAVDQSLDLSRSLNNMSISAGAGRFSLNERSLLQMSSLTEILNDSYFDTSLQVDRGKDATVIASLRAEVESLRSELQKVAVAGRKTASPETQENASRRDRISRNLSQQFDLNSESEAWSEPDRKVSSERIGLDDSAKKSVRSPCALSKFKASSSSSVSEENVDARSTRKNSVLRLQERVAELEAQLAEKSVLLNELQAHRIASEPEAQALRDAVKAFEAGATKLREENEALRDQLHQIHDQYYEAEQKLQVELESTSAELSRLRAECRRTHQDEIRELTERVEELQDEHAQRIDMMASQEAVKLELLRQQLRDEFDQELHAELARLSEDRQRNWVARVEHEQQLRQCEELERRLGDTESLLQLMRENESELKCQVLEHEKMNRLSKRNVDEISMQLSQAVLERTESMSERDRFEKECDELAKKLERVSLEKSELHSKLASLVHENAQLHNKLVSTEAQFELTRSASQGNARYALASPYKSIALLCEGLSSGGDQSDNASDEHKERLENSSPDLGIDSDGRSSGTDVNTSRSPKFRSPKSERDEQDGNVAPALKLATLDFKSDFRSADPLSLSASASAKQQSSGLVTVHHDCEKTEKENAELRRKLERTRRAFEKTWTQLRISNQRKEQIEKDIRQEIYKTHDVLKNVRSNMESASGQLRKPAAEQN